MESEVWKNIPGFEGIYQVSNYGRVKSLPRVVKRKNQGVNEGEYTVKGKILNPKGSPYKSVFLCYEGKHEKKDIHRLVAEVFLGKPDQPLHVNHIDGNKLNNMVNNLEWVTNSENRIHAGKIGLMAKGEDNGASVLTEIDVRNIKDIASKRGYWYGRKKLAERFGVSETTIKNIVNGHRWGHV